MSAAGNVLIPPSKTVSFNAQLKQNDGILVIWLQHALKCQANDALMHLKSFSEYCTGILNAKRRLSIEGIGFFYLDFENNICFEPQPDANFLTQSFGLSPVTLKELDPVVSEPVKKPDFTDRVIHTQVENNNVKPKLTRSYNKLVTPLLVAILCVSILSVLVNNSSIKGELKASLFAENSKGVYKPLPYSEWNILTEPLQPLVYVTDANGIATIDFGATTLAVIMPEGNSKLLSVNRSLSKQHQLKNKEGFEIVLGCFTLVDNAKRMLKKLKQQKINASVSGKNAKAMYVVSSGHFASKEDAVSSLIELKERFPNAWIRKAE